MPASEQQSKPKIEEVIVEHLSEERIIEILKHNGVPKRFLSARREKIPSKTWKMTEGFLNGDSLFLYGNPGVGKTYLIVALCYEMASTNLPKNYYQDGYRRYYQPSYPWMMSVPDLLLKIRESFREGSVISEYGIITQYTDEQCLILDDFGAEKTTEWSLQTLYTIIDRRYREMLQTVITSNLTLDELSGKIGDRIVSRIVEMCKVIEIKGPDRRVEKK